MKIIYIISFIISIYQIYSIEKFSEKLKPNIKIGVYCLFVHAEKFDTSGYNALIKNEINKEENKTIEENLETQHISKEYVSLYQKYPWLSINIKTLLKLKGLSASLPLSLASLLEKNLAKENDQINFTLFATGELTEKNGIIDSIGGFHEKLYAIEEFLKEHPEQKNSCLIALSKKQKIEYELILNENKTLRNPLFLHLPQVKALFIKTLPHDLTLITEYINQNYAQFSYEYMPQNTYQLDTKKMELLEKSLFNNLFIAYFKKNLKKDKESYEYLISNLIKNYNHLFFNYEQPFIHIPKYLQDLKLHNTILIAECCKKEAIIKTKKVIIKRQDEAIEKYYQTIIEQTNKTLLAQKTIIEMQAECAKKDYIIEQTNRTILAQKTIIEMQTEDIIQKRNFQTMIIQDTINSKNKAIYSLSSLSLLFFLSTVYLLYK